MNKLYRLKYNNNNKHFLSDKSYSPCCHRNESIHVAMDSFVAIETTRKLHCVGCYELLVVLAISEATAAMETVDGLVCCDWLGWWCVTANGDGGITEFECPAI